ncbi:MAG: hypothetical protein GY750_19500 [Lentisphaerae bacterium]|nr:hypothetical protein [Lentisphaerota bacterium]MCP4103583.1 hypothetical protein [Lentisphaerota bacterium]
MGFISAYFLMLIAECDDDNKDGQIFLDSIERFDNPHTSRDFFVEMKRPRNSLPFNFMPAIRINYQINDPFGFYRMKEEIKLKLAAIVPPAKLYICAHGHKDANYIEASCRDERLKKDIRTPITDEEMAIIMRDSIPAASRHDIVFHFLCCNANYFAKSFIKIIHSKGYFRNCMAVSYDSRFKLTYESVPRHATMFTLGDFSTKNRFNPKTDTFSHRSDLPPADRDSFPDNKKLTFWHCGQVLQFGYRKAVSSNRLLYGKDVFDYDHSRIDLYVLLLRLNEFLRKAVKRSEKRKCYKVSSALKTIYLVGENYSRIHSKYNIESFKNILESMLFSLEQILTSYHPSEASGAELIDEAYHSFKEKIKPLLQIEIAAVDYMHPDVLKKHKNQFHVTSGQTTVEMFTTEVIQNKAMPDFSQQLWS